MASFYFQAVNCLLDFIKLLKSRCLEVVALMSESKSAIKELVDMPSELLPSEFDQIEYFQNRVQSSIRGVPYGAWAFGRWLTP